MKASSGTNSPQQQVKSRSSMGHHNNGVYNNNLYNSQQRPNFMNKSTGGRAKTGSRKKRNLYTSVGNYYQGVGTASSMPQSANVNIPSKRVNNNLLE